MEKHFLKALIKLYIIIKKARFLTIVLSKCMQKFFPGVCNIL